MRFATNARSVCVSYLLACSIAFPAYSDTFDGIIRESAIKNGFTPAAATYVPVDPELAEIGRVFFESKALSLNSDIACRTCHLDEFSSADGLPNAIGVLGVGRGAERALSRGTVVPRNTLPLWGRGAREFDVFFWDGKVDFSGGQQVSQFGGSPPSEDPLLVAVHLPPVELREMLTEDAFVAAHKNESVETTEEVYAHIVERLRSAEPEAVAALAARRSRTPSEVPFQDVAEALAAFIRSEFRIQPTPFHHFVFERADLPQQARLGARLFYGKGKCASCHAGPFFSDLRFHAVAFPQLGFGKNGFGIDYGRFNTTHDPSDLYKFRTPPLLNVTKTAPYGHSGSVPDLATAIRAHFDPLSEIPIDRMSDFDRFEFYKRLSLSAPSIVNMGFLSDSEVEALIAFLNALTFD